MVTIQFEAAEEYLMTSRGRGGAMVSSKWLVSVDHGTAGGPGWRNGLKDSWRRSGVAQGAWSL